MNPYVIGIDIGTGSTKAVALNLKGEVVLTSQAHYSSIIAQERSEQDPEWIWEAFVNCIHTITEELAAPPSLIGLSSYMHGIMAIDADGKPLTNLITWQDRRSAPIAEGLRSSEEAEHLYATSGTPIHSMSPLCKLIWFKENEPTLFTKAARFISVKEYIWHKLFNVYQVDHSIASAMGMMEVASTQWSSRALKLAGITSSRLSELVPCSYTAKGANESITNLLGVKKDTVFCIGGNDGCLATLGSYASDKGTCALTIGTSAAVRIASNKPVHNYPGMTFNYILDDNTFICGGPLNNGGNVVQWLLKNFLQKGEISEGDYTELFAQLGSVPPASDGLVFLPYLYGERAPVWDEQTSGVYFGIKPHHTQAHFLRATLEGICYALNTVLSMIESEENRIHQIHVSGGFTHSETWMKLLADATGKKVLLFQTEDASAIGAALMGMKSAGLISSYADLAPDPQRTIEPDLAQTERHRKNQAIFNSLYHRLKDLMHQQFQ